MTTVGGEMWRLAVRRKAYVAVPMCASVAVAWLVANAKPPEYVAEATLALQSRQVEVIKTDAVVSRLPQDGAALRTELDVIGSRSMAEHVAERLDLVNEPKFHEALNLPHSPWRQVTAKLRSAVMSASANGDRDAGAGKTGGGADGPLSGATGDPDRDSNKDDADPRRAGHAGAVDWLLSRLHVVNDGRSLTIGVSFRSHDPDLAARIANAFAASYLDDQLETKVQATRMASAWLNERLKDMRRDLEASEAAVQRFRNEMGLVEARGTTVAGQQVNELNSQLVAARAERAQARALLRTAAERGRDGKAMADLPAVLNSTAVQTLWARLYDVQTKLDQERDRWRGPIQTSVTSELESEMASIKRQLDGEIARVVAGLENEAKAAAEKEAQIEAALRIAENRFGESEAKVRLNQLEREADANRAIYESFLNRYKETIEQAALATPDARLISLAKPPVSPAGPRRLPILMLGLVGGVGLGGALAFARERLDRSVRYVAEIEEIAGAPVVGLLPPVGTKGGGGAPLKRARAARRFKEALHRAQAVLRLSAGSTSGPKVIMVTSALPGEGKTWFCLTLARSLAMSGRRVLILDFDLKQSCLRRLCRNGKHRGSFSDVICGRLALSEAADVGDGFGVHCLDGRNTVRGQPEIELSDLEMLMRRGQIEYDAVILDTPALNVAADAAVIASLSEVNLLLVRWGKTSRQAMSSAVRFFCLCDAALDGVVVADVDPRKYAQYDRLPFYAPLFKPRVAPEVPSVASPGGSGATVRSTFRAGAASSSRSSQAVAPSARVMQAWIHWAAASSRQAKPDEHPEGKARHEPT